MVSRRPQEKLKSMSYCSQVLEEGLEGPCREVTARRSGEGERNMPGNMPRPGPGSLALVGSVGGVLGAPELG